MIERYILPRMGTVWSDENRYKTWLEIEILASEAQAERGRIPKQEVAKIKKDAGFDVARIQEIEKEVRHDVVAFLTNLSENVGPAARYIHMGMTSSDVLDTALSVLMRDAAEILIEDIKQLTKIIKDKALTYKDTLMVGRTHGVHAEPTTYGLKLLLQTFEMKRNLTRLEQAKEVISYGKISGAVGTYSNIDPFIEKHVCEKLGIKPAEVSTQVLQRDRHAQYLATLAIVASSLDKFATEIRALQRTEILEVEEPFVKGQKGSSAMPHKKNPIICERISGLARIIRANAQAAFENVSLWHERDISHSSVERVIIPDSTILLDYMLNKFTEVMSGLVVHPNRMKANLDKTKGLVFSQRIMLGLVEKELSREEAYKVVQQLAMKAWEEDEDFKQLVLEDPKVKRHVTQKELKSWFDYNYYLSNVDEVFNRLEGV